MQGGATLPSAAQHAARQQQGDASLGRAGSTQGGDQTGNSKTAFHESDGRHVGPLFRIAQLIAERKLQVSFSVVNGRSASAHKEGSPFDQPGGKSICRNPIRVYLFLCAVQVCLHFARKLQQQQDRWPLDRFLEDWQASVPEVSASAACDFQAFFRSLEERKHSERWL